MNEETDFSASDLKHWTTPPLMGLDDSKDNTFLQIFYFLKYI